MKDVMLDLEAFGSDKNCCICQIGAAYFDRDTGEVGQTLKINVDARTTQKSGADIDADTVYWWLSQTREAIDSITAGELVDIAVAMNTLNEFLAPAKCIWSHSTYDFVAISETYKRLNIKPLFHHRTGMDIRTLVNLSGLSIKGSTHLTNDLPHDALSDCFYQIKYCVEAMNKIKKPLK